MDMRLASVCLDGVQARHGHTRRLMMVNPLSGQTAGAEPVSCNK